VAESDPGAAEQSAASTREDLVEACGAAHWSDHGFRRALDKAVSSGKIRRLSDDLYEIVEPASPPRSA
jgi:hypothetical protein